MRNGHLSPEHTTVFDQNGIRGFVTAAHNQLVSLFVDPTYQGRGIGSALLSRAKTSFRSLDLAVFVENTNGVLFYHRRGFLVLERKLFPPAQTDVLIMKWTQD